MRTPPTSDPLVSTAWLADHIADPGLVILDATYTMPGIVPAARDVFAASHIAGAVFFDIDVVADQSTALPHMLPPAPEFERHARALGISDTSHIVVYDRPGLMSAGRAWWSFRLFGHDRVSILDGGWRKWLAEGRPTTADPPVIATGNFIATLRPALVRGKADMLRNLATAHEQVVDARSVARFTAAEGEPRPGLRLGHIPGSRNLPFGNLTDPATGQLRSPAEIAALFRQAGIDIAAPVVTTCGTGVTAAALAFGLHLLDAPAVAVYDGSWAEWGLPGDTPVEP